MNGRLEYVKKNIILGYSNKILGIVLEFIARTVFIKILGEEILGISGVFTNIIQILSIAELGINNVVSYSLYEPLAKNDYLKINKLINFYKKIYNIISSVILMIGLLIIPFLNRIVNEDINFQNLLLIYFLFLLDTICSYLFVYKGILLNADQKGYIVVKYTMIFNFFRICLQIIVLYYFKSFISYLCIKIIITILLNLKIAKISEKTYVYLKTINKKLSKNEEYQIINIIKSGFIYKISGVLLNSTDNILISVIVGTIWVGYLSNYLIIITALSSVYTILFSSVTSSIGNLIFTENLERRSEIFNLMLFISSWLTIVLSICFLLLVNDFIRIWLGDNFILDKKIVIAQTIILSISCSLQPLFCFREALGLYQKTKYMMLLAAILNISLSIILGRIWGITGILYATILSMLCTYIWYEPVILYKEYFKSSPLKYFKKKGYDLFFVFLGLYISIDFIDKFKVLTWLGWMGKGIVIFFLTNIYCMFIYHKKIEFKILLKKIIKRSEISEK